MSFSPPPSPPPPLPSPLLVPTPLPSPPPFTNLSSRRRLTLQSHPSSPRTLSHASSCDALHRAPNVANTRRPASPPRTIKRTLSQLPSRCRSPPPTPPVLSPPPPVPPIPAFVLTTNHSFVRPPRRPSIPNRVSAFDLYLDHPEDIPNMCCESQAGALTRVQFVAVHNPTGQCHS